MATFYLDFEGGNDSNDGTSFANRWKTINSGATSARIAPGDTIRIMGSPAPTSLGNGTWFDGNNESSQSITSSTNASPIVITRASHGYSNDDFVVVYSHNVNTAANGVWKIANVTSDTFELVGSTGNGTGSSGSVIRVNNSVVELESALTQDIACTSSGRAIWTASTNVTASINSSNRKSASYGDQFIIASGFTTGKAAYFATGSLDLSGYQQVSFLIRQNSGTLVGDSGISLALCSDTIGDTVVDTINIPALSSLFDSNAITIDTGGALGSNIQSIALYINTDSGAQTFIIENIIACKASSADDSLSLTSLIGKNTSGDPFMKIMHIKDTIVYLDHDNSSKMEETFGYYVTAETVTTYKRETIKANFTSTIQDSGTDGSPIVFDGGWNRTDMSTKTLETWMDGITGASGGWLASSKDYITINDIHLVGYNTGMSFNSTCNNYVLDGVSAAHCDGACFDIDGDYFDFTDINAHSSGSIGFSISGDYFLFNSDLNLFGIQNAAISSNGNYLECQNINITNCSTSQNPISISGTNILIKDLVTQYCPYGSLFSGSNTKIDSVTTSNISNQSQYALNLHGTNIIIKSVNISGYTSAMLVNAPGPVSIFGGTIDVPTSVISATSTVFSDISIKAALLDSTTVVVPSTDFSNHRLAITDTNANTHSILVAGGRIDSEDTIRHTASGYSWAFKPTDIDNNSIINPLYLSFKVACSANNEVTISAWVRRDNTELTMRLIAYAGQLAGMSTDVSATITESADTWEELTINFTPTESGVFEFRVEAWGGSTRTGYVDDLTITQA